LRPRLRCSAPLTAQWSTGSMPSIPGLREDSERATAFSWLLRQDAAQSGPRKARRRCGGKSPQGTAQDARSFADVHGRTSGGPPERLREPGGQDARRARLPGCVSSVTFFAQAKKVTRSAAGRVEAFGFYDDKQQRTARARSNWIPAFAGMTSRKQQDAAFGRSPVRRKTTKGKR